MIQSLEQAVYSFARMEIKSLPAYKLNVDQHILFLTSRKAYVTYVEYWNSKGKK